MISDTFREYVEAEEAARILGVKVSTLYAYASRGRLISYREGAKRRRLYRRSELESLIDLAPVPRGRERVPLAEDWIPFTG